MVKTKDKMSFWARLATENSMKRNGRTVNGRTFDKNDNNYYLALMEKTSHSIE